MKARDTDRTTTRRIVMLKAADMVEREGRYKFSVCDVPTSCADEGCVLGWIGFCAGHAGETHLERTAQWLGYKDSGFFYQEMDHAAGRADWTCYPVIAAQTLRKLANEASDATDHEPQMRLGE